uniref:CCHC-type domain-containing protein n=1 Tax=Strigamia maritima TaxID=126957 RepID=T1JFV5_STRMM
MRNRQLCEKLQLVDDLTLEKAINTARMSEQVRRRQGELQTSLDVKTEIKTEIGCIKTEQSDKQKLREKPARPAPKPKENKEPCGKCGYETHYTPKCPAIQSKCQNCKKICHYSRMCRSAKAAAVEIVHSEDDSSDYHFMGYISSVNSVRKTTRWSVSAC